jgi:hypothetical protein
MAVLSSPCISRDSYYRVGTLEADAETSQYNTDKWHPVKDDRLNRLPLAKSRLTVAPATQLVMAFAWEQRNAPSR